MKPSEDVFISEIGIGEAYSGEKLTLGALFAEFGRRSACSQAVAACSSVDPEALSKLFKREGRAG